jgi:flagellar hook-associated protein 1 FlgK
MGKVALNAFRQGIDTAGHNIANSGTTGYSRQRANYVTTDPFAAPGLSSPVVAGQIGTGVTVSDIVRIRDAFLDLQYRSQMSTLGYWNRVNDFYTSLQMYISEPASAGILEDLDTFWSAVQDLSKDPTNSAARETVVQSANSIGSALDTLAESYYQYADMANNEIVSLVDEANSLLHQVAELNTSIYQVKASGQNPNDLLDKRDLLLDRLTELIDIDIQEPYASGDTTGEFFITLNGRTLVQGNQVRELVAHAFQWNNQTYYDVQVANNEFDIVDNPSVALALATGPEGVHQLRVDRLANGLEWTIGGADPYCLDPDGAYKQSPVDSNIKMLTRPMTTTEALGLSTGFRIQVGTQGTRVYSNIFSNTANPGDMDPGDILGEGKAGDSYTFRIGANDYQIDITVAWDDINGKWRMTSDTDPTGSNASPSATSHLTVDDLTDFLTKVLPSSGDAAFTVNKTKNASGVTTSFYISSANNYLMSITDVDGDLASKMGMANPSPVISIDIDETDSLETIRNKINEKYNAALGITEPEQWVHAELLQNSDGSWYLTIAADVAGEAQRITLMGDEDGNMQTLRRLGLVSLENTGIKVPQTYFVDPAVSSTDGVVLYAGTTVGETKSFTIDDGTTTTTVTLTWDGSNWSDGTNSSTGPNGELLVSDLLKAMLPVAPTVHTDPVTGRQYLQFATGVTITDDSGDILTQSSYREVTAYSKVAEDASFTFDSIRYLSADNTFEQARRVPAAGSTDYSATVMDTVSEGIWLDLKGVGSTAITVRHHVQNGEIKALEDLRDGIIPHLQGELDELAWTLVNNFNAYQYSGYGIGDNTTTTGVAFFDALSTKYGAASALSVSHAVENDVSLIGAAIGKLDANGNPLFIGVSDGDGSGENAARMAELMNAKLLGSGSATLREYYEQYLAEIGSDAGRASLLSEAQQNLVDQIDAQRQSVMGVNIDEEMLDILRFNQAFNAMSRYVTTIDEMLDRIINSFGTVGL